MTEEVLFEREEGLPRAEIATYLRTVADRLDAGETITFTGGEQSIELKVPARPVFEVKVERESASGGQPDELSIEFELEWNEGSGEGGELSIE